jgi:deoxyribose-phosphate aldolase
LNFELLSKETNTVPMISPAGRIDHTLLKADATEGAIALLCEEAVEYGFASVCIPPVFIGFAANLLYGSEVAVGTVVGFPLGYDESTAKAFAAERAVAAGAHEIDMVIRLGAVRAGQFDRVLLDIRQVVAAAGDAVVKVIIECCLFDDETKIRLVETVVQSGAHYVKTSTGFAASGASAADVALLKKAAAGRIRVKAAGGIRDWLSCRAMLAAGADRIGSSAGREIIAQWRQNSVER